MSDPTLESAARAWIAADPDPATRAELQAMLDRGDPDLPDRLGPRLPFGTAGIRGPLGAGPARMNRLVVRLVGAGLAARLGREAGATERGVIVGRDARHQSAAFAGDTAGVLAAAGFVVRRFADPVPTPLVAFATRHLDAAAGVQITASHNPPADNGYKVYWSGGAQITDSIAAEIAVEIDRIDDPAAVAVAADSALVDDVGDEVRDAYLDACLSLRVHPGATAIRLVYTPLHGVAADTLSTLFERAGFSDLAIVEAQRLPDPDFPTVSFPNPEEPGALDLAVELAAGTNADLVLANDPDGDRIAVAVPSGDGWRTLSGDEIGCLLAEYLLAEGDGQAERTVITTVVSSRLLVAIAAHHGVRYAETLTGFKWLAAAAERARSQGGRPVLAYEQALGVMAGEAVRDKDGISAALLVAELAAVQRARGRTLGDALDDLARRHGVHLTGGRSLRLDGPGAQALVAGTLERLSSSPPDTVGGARVREVTDYSTGARDLPPTPLVALELEDDSRLLVRPSGTEPLLKFYVEVVEPVGDAEVGAARKRAGRRLDALADAFLAAATDHPGGSSPS